MFNKDFTYAIVGASRNEDKFGFKVLKDIKDSNFKAIPINPNEQEIYGEKCYASIKDFPNKIDMVIFVVPPEITLKILNEVKELNIENVWMQPGSESQKAIEFCNQNKIHCEHNTCIMIKRDSND